MAGDTVYFPSNGQYLPDPYSIYAQYYVDSPNPCRKYHVSSALEGAGIVAGIVLPVLAARDICHKVVKSHSFLSKQTEGKQVGKFITIYMSANVPQRNAVIEQLGQLLGAARAAGRIHPCHTVPKSRPYAHVFMEQPLDEAMFIYGGFVCSPHA
jgi:hypothetical protein